jgi:Holliday junction resolvase RusA-like endonuclease
VSATVITIPGKPFAWRRARSHGKIRFKDRDTEQHEAALQAIVLRQMPVPLEGAVRISVRAVFKIPESWSAKKKAAHLWRAHTQKPDLSNIIKHLEDGLNRIAWVDDSAIAEYGPSAKVWGDRDETILTVEALA